MAPLSMKAFLGEHLQIGINDGFSSLFQELLFKHLNISEVSSTFCPRLWPHLGFPAVSWTRRESKTAGTLPWLPLLFVANSWRHLLLQPTSLRAICRDFSCL